MLAVSLVSVLYSFLATYCLHLIQQVFIFIYHDFIAPCFDKYTPLPEGQLRAAIEKLASSLSFPLKKLLVVEGSKRSAHSNAYFYGFWKNKCIVLFDTLVEEGVLQSDVAIPTKTEVDTPEAATPEDVSIGEGAMPTEEDTKKNKGCNTEEVLGVLAHELGHWKLSHNIINIIISEVRTEGFMYMSVTLT